MQACMHVEVVVTVERMHGFEARIPLHARDRSIDPLDWIEYVQYNFKKMKEGMN